MKTTEKKCILRYYGQALKLAFLVAALSFFMGCQLQEVPITMTKITIKIPTDALQAGKDSYKIKIANTATGRVQNLETDSAGSVSADIEEGVYNIEVVGKKTISTTVTNGTDQQTFTKTVDISGILQKITISGQQVFLSVPLFITQAGNGFIIKEIYYAGSKTPKEGSYYQDQFIEIFNNSDSTLYADGYSIAESNHISSLAVPEFTEYPNDLIVRAIYTIPGAGQEHPVLPGKSLVIASLGIDHKAANENSPVDLSKADFEWFDAGKDPDIIEVPNMLRTYCYSNTIWVLFVKGTCAYVLFKANGSYSDFLAANTINVATTSGSTVPRVKVSHALIVDGVELGTAGSIGSKSLPASIDLSYTYCDGSYIGKSVRRKVLIWENGRAKLQDTNNSANDFIPNADPKPGIVE